MASSNTKVLQDLIAAGAVLESLHCLPASDGNLSARVGTERIVITRTGISKRVLNKDSFVELSIHEEKPSGASTEWVLHRSLYVERPGVNCVMHVHSPFLTAFAVTHRIPNVNLLAEAVATIGEIVFVPFHSPGSQELGESLLKTSETASVYLLANHGVVVVGSTVQDTLYRLERTEFLASVELHSAHLGKTVALTATQVASILE